MVSQVGSRYSGITTYLTSNNLDDENTLTEPTRVAPGEHQLQIVGQKYNYQVEGNSFTVLKLHREEATR